MRAASIRRGADSGAAAVEFALLFPLFLAIVFGIIDMGFGFNQKINLTQAARETSRYGATLSLNASAVPPAVVGTPDTWLQKVMTVALSSGGSDLDSSRSGRFVCVAYIVGGTQRKAVVTTSNTPTISTGTCGLSTTRTDDRIEVQMRSDTLVDFLFLGGKITVGGSSVTHFEAVTTP